MVFLYLSRGSRPGCLPWQAGTQAGGQYGVAWFQFNGNTFIVQDVDATAGFTDGQDIIVKLTGLVDLSASSFNEAGQGTLLYI